MKFLLLAALVSVAVALPRDGLVTPGAAGPAPVIIDDMTFPPIAIGPAIIDSFEPVAIGPAVIGGTPEPIAIGPAIVDFPIPAPAAPPTSNPLVQIILNINTAGYVPSAPVSEVKPTPVHVVESVSEPISVEPIQVVEVAPTPIEPIIIGTPILPVPVAVLPETLN